MIRIERKEKEVQINILQSDSGSEIEDLMNPKDELKKRIVTLAGTMKEWNEKTKEARKSVRKQLEDIIDLGLNKHKMEKTELRKLINQIFEYHGIHQSWLRKLLPKELKDSSKTRLSYLQRQEIEKERQRLLLHQASESQQEFEAEIEYESLPDGSVMVSSPYQSQDSKSSPSSLEAKQELATEYEVYQSPSPKTSVPSSEESNTLEFRISEDKLSEVNKKIESLEAEVQRLSEPFDAKANLPTIYEDVP